MRRINRYALCLLAISVTGALTATTAAALPQFWQNGSPIGAGIKKEFTGTTGAMVLKTGAHKIACTAGLSIGETNGPGEVAKIGLWLIECKETNSGVSCRSTSPAGAEGEIITEPLKGPLGYLKATTPVKAGLLLNPGGARITKLACGTLEGEVRGSVIGELKPINVQQGTWEAVFAEAAGGVQEWTKFEGETAVHTLEAFAEPAVLVATYKATWSGAEKLEIKA